jgi:hypothetical protein
MTLNGVRGAFVFSPFHLPICRHPAEMSADRHAGDSNYWCCSAGSLHRNSDEVRARGIAITDRDRVTVTYEHCLAVARAHLAEEGLWG